MAHPRTTEQSENYWRRAAVARLRDMGITLSKFRQNAEGVASEIRRIEPAYKGGDANMVIRAWMGGVATPKAPTVIRPYKPSNVLRFMAERAKVQPALRALVSNVQEWRELPGGA